MDKKSPWFAHTKKKKHRNVSSFHLSERRDSNPRPSAWKANALSTELLSQFREWAVKDSNLRSRKTAELQSAPVGHFGNYPFFLKRCKDK